MPDRIVERLPASTLEDLAFVVLTARRDEDLDLYPELSDETRSRLRSRLKQISRYDWPTSLKNDPALKRGYTLRQCCRLAVALLLLDAHLPPSLAIAIARDNDEGLLRVIAHRLEVDPQKKSESDLIAVLRPAEIIESLGLPDWSPTAAEQISFVCRSQLNQLWSDATAGPGSRLVIDVATAANAMWCWISGRRLMTDIARLELLGEIEARAEEPAYNCSASRPKKRET